MSSPAPAPLPPSPSLRLDGRVAWVTGASRGLGRALALALAGAGAELLLSARSGDAVHELAEEIRAGGGRAEVAVGSVADPGDVAAAAATRCSARSAPASSTRRCAWRPRG